MTIANGYCLGSHCSFGQLLPASWSLRHALLASFLKIRFLQSVVLSPSPQRSLSIHKSNAVKPSTGNKEAFKPSLRTKGFLSFLPSFPPFSCLLSGAGFLPVRYMTITVCVEQSSVGQNVTNTCEPNGPSKNQKASDNLQAVCFLSFPRASKLFVKALMVNI